MLGLKLNHVDKGGPQLFNYWLEKKSPLDLKTAKIF